MSEEKFPQTEKTTITRLSQRGVYDKETIYTILDKVLYCTIAFVKEGKPFQIPTGFCRIQDTLYIHGSVGSSYMRELAEKQLPVCISVTQINGIVLARSAFHHSVNYKSVIIFTEAKKITNKDEMYKSLEVLTNKMQPGRWNDIRKPSQKEWNATMVLAFSIEEASAKIRTGPPKDDVEDYALNIWAGVVPLQLQKLSPISDEKLKEGVELPKYLK